jgi:hypothetical protein
VKYDHFDTLSILLQRFLFENPNFPNHDLVSSLYGIGKHSNTPQPFCDPRNNVLFFPPHVASRESTHSLHVQFNMEANPRHVLLFHHTRMSIQQIKFDSFIEFELHKSWMCFLSVLICSKCDRAKDKKLIRKKGQIESNSFEGAKKDNPRHIHLTHTHTHTHTHTQLTHATHTTTPEYNANTKQAPTIRANKKTKTKQEKTKQNKTKMKFVSLPKDVLAMVFSHLWRIEAKGVPLTCKLFHEVVSSQRFFESNFKHFTIAIIQSAHTAKRGFISARNQETFLLKYDHFDTFSSLLAKVQSKDSSSSHIRSLYAYAHTGRVVAFQEKSLVTAELCLLNCTVLYASEFTWSELRDNTRTWCDFVRQGGGQ